MPRRDGRARRTLLLLLVLAIASVPVLTAIQPPQPSERQRLRIVGGVGYGQFIRIARWLANGVAAQPGAPEIWFGHHVTGEGFRDSVLMLATGQAELALVNGRGVAAMAVRGRGMFERPVTDLRAIAALPHRDWTLFAVDAALGVRSFADIAARGVPLRLATGRLDGDNAVGFIAAELFRRHGVAFDELKRWGGQVLPGRPGAARERMLAGHANAILQEGAARAERWESMARQRPLAFLSVDRQVADVMKRELGVGTIEVPAGYYPGQTAAFLAVDFSDWLICVRNDLPDAVAYQLAQIVVEEWQALEREYLAEMPRRDSSINFPLEPGKLVDTAPVPLHPAAARYYREHGIAPAKEEP